MILGCLQLKSNLLESSDKFIRIWVHEAGFQIDALSSASDWLIFKKLRFDWLRVQSSKYQFENSFESYRVFADRLVDISDQERFFEIVKDATSDNFKCSLEKVLSHLSQESVTEPELF